MSPLRKRPQCQKCGGLMAGHKRPNGILTCPTEKVSEPPLAHSPLRREAAVAPPISPGGVYRYRNPNWEEPEGEPFIHRHERNDTPDTWVSTEPADDIPTSFKHEPIEDHLDRPDIQHIPYRVPSVASSSSSVIGSSTSSRLRRSFSSLLTNGVPLLSLFSTPKEDISTITRAARRNGLHTGVLRRPGLEVIKEEGDDTVSTVKRKKGWWVILGTDPEAVEHLMDLQERDTIARLEAAAGEIPLQRIATTQPTTQRPTIQLSFTNLLVLIILSCVLGAALLLFAV